MNSLKELHWLPVEYQVKYKNPNAITHKCIYGNVPAYLKRESNAGGLQQQIFTEV